MNLKFETKDYIALVTAALTIGSVVWKGGEITSQLAATAKAVEQMAPVVNRLDASTARLEATAEANKSRITDLTRRVELIEQYTMRNAK